MLRRSGITRTRRFQSSPENVEDNAIASSRLICLTRTESHGMAELRRYVKRIRRPSWVTKKGRRFDGWRWRRTGMSASTQILEQDYSMGISRQDMFEWLVDRYGQERVQDHGSLGMMLWGTMTRNFLMTKHPMYDGEVLLVLLYVDEFGMRSRRIRYDDSAFFERLKGALDPSRHKRPKDSIQGAALEYLRSSRKVESVAGQRVVTNDGVTVESLLYRHSGREFDILHRPNGLLLGTQCTCIEPMRRCTLAIEDPRLFERLEGHLERMCSAPDPSYELVPRHPV